MSDNIPFDIQREIIKKVSDIQSLLRFRAVSKPWKSFIDSSEFIKGYGARHKQQQPHNCFLMHKVDYASDYQYHHLSDDAIKGPQQKFIASPFFKEYHVPLVIGECHGLLCLFCCPRDTAAANRRNMLVVWNPCIGKSFGIGLPIYPLRMSWLAYGFGVCPVTNDPTVVKVFCEKFDKPWHVEVFTLSSGVWNVIPSSKLPRQSVILNPATMVAIDRFIYWGAYEMTSGTINQMVVSFDLITKKFKVVNLSDNVKNELRNELDGRLVVDGRLAVVRVAKLRESLVVYGFVVVEGAICCGVWVMENNSSFKKLFTIGSAVKNILGFMKSGEPIVEILNHERSPCICYPSIHKMKSLVRLGISPLGYSFVMDSYKESLLLLDHSNSHIYLYVN